MNREKNNSKNDEDCNKKGSNKISEEKQELSENNTVEDGQNVKHELIDSNIVEDSQNAKQVDKLEDIKTTENIRDEEESSNRDINEKKYYTKVCLKVKRENNQTLKMYQMEKNNWKINSLKKRKQRRMLTHQKSHAKN